jgi:hypothetical protein
MKVVFNGVLEKHRSGCNCKRVANTEYGFVSQKMYILPSGATKTFIVGKPEEVSEQDGAFLLAYKYVDVNGSYREVFSKVE